MKGAGLQTYGATQAQRLLQLLLLAAAAWAVVYTRFTLGPLQEAMRVDLELTDNQMALLNGAAVAVPLAVGAIPAGLIFDRNPRVPLVVLLLATGVAATVLTAVTDSMLLLILGRALVGIVAGAVLIAAFSLLADLYEPAQRGRATMVLLIGELGGPPAAFALGGVLLAMGSSSSMFGLEGWRWALLWMSLPVLACVLLMSALREPPRTGVVLKNPPLRQVLPELWRYRGVVGTLLVARMMAWVGDGAMMMWGAPIFERNFSLSAQRTGAIMASALLISGLVGPIVGGPLADYCQRRGGPRRTMTVMGISMLLAAPAALFGIAPDAALASAALTLYLCVGFTGAASGMAVATVAIPGEVRAVFIAATFALGSLLSFGLAPLLVSSLSTALGGTSMVGHAVAMVSGVTTLIGGIVIGVGRKYFAAGTEQGLRRFA